MVARLIVAWLLLATSVRAAGPWVDHHKAGNFACRSEFPLKEVRDLLDDLGELQTDIEETLGLTVKNQEIEVLLFRGRASYVEYLSKRVPEGTKRQALYVQGPDSSRVYAYKNHELAIDVRHEATHALLHQALPYVPLWLDEGLAEYFEVPAPQRNSGDGHRGEIKWAIRLGWKPELTHLESKRELSEMGKKDYRDAWAWIHFLLAGPPEAKAAFTDYLEEIRSGKAPKPLSTHLSRRIPQLEQQVLLHFR